MSTNDSYLALIKHASINDQDYLQGKILFWLMKFNQDRRLDALMKIREYVEKLIELESLI